MKKIVKCFALGGMLLTGAGAAQAKPTLEPVRAHLSAPPTVTLYADDKDPTLVWVGPPGREALLTRSFQTSFDEGQCKTLKGYQNAIVDQRKRYQPIIDSLGELSASLSKEIPPPVDRIKQVRDEIKFQQELRDEEVKSIKAEADDFVNYNNGNKNNFISQSYTTSWRKAVADLPGMNPGYRFVPLQIDGIKFSFTAPGGSSGQVLSAEINGKPIDQINGSAYSGYPDQVNANLSVNAALGCLTKYPKLYLDNVDEFAKFMTLEYNFQVATKTRLTVRVDLKKLYHFYENKGHESRLFTNRDWDEMVESSLSSLAINADFDFDNAVNPISFADQYKMKRELTEDLLAQVPLLLQQKNLVPPNLMTGGANGADTLAGALDKTCGQNPKCVAGAFALRALSALFGSSEATATIDSSTDAVLTDVFTSNTPIRRSGVVVFGPVGD